MDRKIRATPLFPAESQISLSNSSSRAEFSPEQHSIVSDLRSFPQLPNTRMDELDETQLQEMVESLKQQLEFPREKTSVSIPDLAKWVEEKIPEDPFLNPDLLKVNPWVESGKCVVI